MYRLHYQTDGTLEGLLTAISEAQIRGEDPVNILIDPENQESLFDSHIPILTDPGKAEELRTQIIQRLTEYGYDKVKKLYLAEDSNRGGVALRYLRYTLKHGQHSLGHLAQQAVADAEDIIKQVEKEAHFMIQFIRFAEIQPDIKGTVLLCLESDSQHQLSTGTRHKRTVPFMSSGLYYAHIQPKARVLPLIMGHFAARYNIQPFIIHDSRHSMAGLFDTQRWWLVADDTLRLPVDADGLSSLAEDGYQDLWRTFYRTLTIPERRNPTSQRNVMP
ncbi:MAG: TIGR03915 family putative DNA repair protein, partial [Coriobacteriales bacterium]|nr:TIGR03915 family putative DNA repair protein [Coriobacteriales bacterium]